MPATEKQFMATVIAYAKLHRWLVFHPHDSRPERPRVPRPDDGAR